MAGILRLIPKGVVDSLYGRVAEDDCPDWAALSNVVPSVDSPNQYIPKPGNFLLGTPTYNIVGTTKYVILTSVSSSPWTVPADWNAANNTIWCIGGGGNGGNGNGSTNTGGGGGGGACAWVTNIALTGTISFQVGLAGGTTGSGTSPTANTWFKDISTIVAAGGGSGVNNAITAGAAGSAVNSVGAGGIFAGGIGGVGYLNAGGAVAGGGGGAGGSTAAGTAGVAGAAGSGGTGGQGDGSTGGAGGAEHTAGSAGAEIADGIGSGGGGGGGVTGGTTTGGAGGAYGAGGGGGGESGGTHGAGSNGVIIIQYTVATQYNTITNITCQTIVGDFVYGMGNDPLGSGYDVPFVYNLLLNTSLTVSGITTGSGGNCPTSLSSGAWQPPHVEPVGAYILFAHTGYQGSASQSYTTVYVVLSTPGLGTWTVPVDWNSGQNTVQAIGGGGWGGAAGGGNGAAYAEAVNVSLTPGQVVPYQVGVAGTATSSTGPGLGPTQNSWLLNDTTLIAAGGEANDPPVNYTAQNSVGFIIQPGGWGGAPGGGGGAGGPAGPGGNQSGGTGGAAGAGTVGDGITVGAGATYGSGLPGGNYGGGGGNSGTHNGGAGIILITYKSYEGGSQNYFGSIQVNQVQPLSTIVLPPGTGNWTVPANWNNSNNQVQVIGSGANGYSSYGFGDEYGGGGGAGGGYASLSNMTLTPGANVTVQVGTGGLPSWFSATTTLQGAGGSSGSNVANGSFGSSPVTNVGGVGETSGGQYERGGGGGGAGGSFGAGVAGVLAQGGAGDAGYGGAGGIVNFAGSPGLEDASSVGSGGGGGGGGQGESGGGRRGGVGGAYGGGGGGGGAAAGGYGVGAPGTIIITYTAATIPFVYTAQNTTTNPLPSVPWWIKAFNGRAWFLCNPTPPTQPAALCSDLVGVGNGPLGRSAAVAGVIETFDDMVPLICADVLTLLNIATGTLQQGLFIFKQAGQGRTNIWQITGDVGTNNLTLQAMNTSISTTAPNTLISTAKGLFFMAPDGIRLINQEGVLQPPLGFSGLGVTVPFIYSASPTRTAGDMNGNTLRFTTLNSITGNQEDWCYDIVREAWYGPHTFPIGLITGWGNTFVITPTPGSGLSGFWQADVVPQTTSIYTENGYPMTCTLKSSINPDRREYSQLSCVKSVAYLGYPASNPVYAVTVADVDGNVIGTCSAPNTTLAPTTATKLSPMDIPWIAPLVFDRASVTISTTAAAGVRFGVFHLPYTETGYTARAPGQ